LIVDFALPVLQASAAGHFSCLPAIAHSIRRRNCGEKNKIPLLIQGSRPKALLLEQFKTAGNAVLLGTSSFWEGVDVRGEALSCVIIDKLPFASPGDRC